ncbi:MAG TPA: hypothetical protein VFN89_01340 [Solirubrobacterales bacterium]|nr:hypothetical protein [Solirubrobacterales bacterium]
MIIRATTVPDLALPLATLLPHSAGPYVVLMLIGFAVAIGGHLSGLRWLIAAGIVLIFLGAFLFPLALNLTESTPPALKNR